MTPTPTPSPPPLQLPSLPTCTVGVIGLGYVGLPQEARLALVAHLKGQGARPGAELLPLVRREGLLTP
jgi:hypothetical protein